MMLKLQQLIRYAELHGIIEVDHLRWDGSTGEDEEHAIARVGWLFENLRVQTWYFEVVEMVRRLVHCTILVFIYPSTKHQIICGFLVAFLFLIVSMRRRPYRDPLLEKIHIYSLIAICVTHMFALSLVSENELDSGVADVAADRINGVLSLIVAVFNMSLPLFPLLNNLWIMAREKGELSGILGSFFVGLCSSLRNQVSGRRGWTVSRQVHEENAASGSVQQSNTHLSTEQEFESDRGQETASARSFFVAAFRSPRPSTHDLMALEAAEETARAKVAASVPVSSETAVEISQTHPSVPLPVPSEASVDIVREHVLASTALSSDSPMEIAQGRSADSQPASYSAPPSGSTGTGEPLPGHTSALASQNQLIGEEEEVIQETNSVGWTDRPHHGSANPGIPSASSHTL